MMRALWTASSGMIAQQLNVDTISNNLANVNTTAYKKQRVEFKDLLYDTLSKANNLQGDGTPLNLQVGHGVTASTIGTIYSMGNLEKTDNPLDFAIDGEGFFAARNANGETVYTRDGNFKIGFVNGDRKLVTTEGYPILDESGQDIVIDPTIKVDSLSVTTKGVLTYTDKDNAVQPQGQSLQVVRFPNKEGLLKIGSNLVAKTDASGEPEPETDGNRSTIMQNYLESSNVQTVEEMVKMIVAQRAYEINSKSVQTADEMLGMANNLRR